MHASTEQPTIRESCQPVSGYGGMDLRYTNLTSVKSCRLSAGQKPTIRSKGNVGLTSGYVAESDGSNLPERSNINRRHAARRLAKAQARRSR